MKQSLVVGIVLLGIVMSGAARAAGPPALEYEMVVEGLAGNKSVTLEIESWSWGAQAMEPDPSLPPRKDVSMQDFHFVLSQSPSSMMLLETMLARKALVRVTVRIKQPNTHSFELVMRNAKISSFQTGGSGGGGYGRGDAPMEQLSMTFQTGKLTVKTAAGTHSAEIKN